MPGLIRGVARTAVVAGTATHVSNNVSRRQSNKWAQQDQQDQPAPQDQSAPPLAEPAALDPMAQLKELGELHASGVVTDEEFAAKKAQLLA